MAQFIFLSNSTTYSTLFYSFAWPSLGDHPHVCQLQEQERALLLFTSDNVSETKTNGLYFRGGILLRGGGGCFCRLVFFWVCHQICGGASKSSVSIPWQNIRHELCIALTMGGLKNTICFSDLWREQWTLLTCLVFYLTLCLYSST